MSHALIVTEADGEREYELQHPPGCPMEKQIGGLHDETWWEYRCLEASFFGEDDYEEFGDLEPGRYVIKGHYTPPGWAGANPIDASFEWEVG